MTQVPVADQVEEDNPPGSFEDADEEVVAEAEEKKEKKKAIVPVEDLGDVGWSEKDDAVNVRCIIQYAGCRAGTTDLAYELKFRAELEADLAGELSDMLGQLPLTVTFAGNPAGSGGELKSYRGFADADGDRYIEGVIRFPHSQAHRAGDMVQFVRKGGILALVPDQMKLNLTERAE